MNVETIILAIFIFADTFAGVTLLLAIGLKRVPEMPRVIRWGVAIGALGLIAQAEISYQGLLGIGHQQYPLAWVIKDIGYTFIAIGLIYYSHRKESTNFGRRAGDKGPFKINTQHEIFGRKVI